VLVALGPTLALLNCITGLHIRTIVAAAPEAMLLFQLS
jgi:hypothetical protein